MGHNHASLLTEGKGILRLKPAWVPRAFCRPGRRLKLAPQDLYVYGLARGGIDERWLASATHAENGPDTLPDEGLSYIVSKDGKTQALLRDAVDELRGELIGSELWAKYNSWPIYSKFFDNLGPLPHHIHHDDEKAARVGQKGKPEMYFYPSQLNNHNGEFSFTFFGLNEDVTRDDLKQALMRFTAGDNNILGLSRAYKLELDTGWDVPPGLLHAPGSLCTYEPQVASDVYAMYQSVLYGNHTVGEDLLWKNTPAEEIGNYDYLVDVVNWPLNVDQNFHTNRFMVPKPAGDTQEMADEGYLDEWICYKSSKVCAKRLTIQPGASVVIRDSAAYGAIAIQGHGKIGIWDLEAPAMIRFDQITNDEFFVAESAAREGVTITNRSDCDPLVLLKHFAENKDRLSIIS